MLKPKLQYFGHLLGRTDSFEKTLTLGKIEGRRRSRQRGWDGRMASPIQWTWVWVNSRSWWWTGRPGVLQSMGSQRVGHNWVTELNWSTFQYEVFVDIWFTFCGFLLNLVTFYQDFNYSHNWFHWFGKLDTDNVFSLLLILCPVVTGLVNRVVYIHPSIALWSFKIR